MREAALGPTNSGRRPTEDAVQGEIGDGITDNASVDVFYGFLIGTLIKQSIKKPESPNPTSPMNHALT